MANSDQSKGKIEVNGATHSLNPGLRNAVISKLAVNGGIDRIKDRMKQGLDECGWSEAVREEATRLLRSGEVTTFPELEERMKILVGPPLVDSENTLSSVKVPRASVQPGADQIKKEVEAVTEPKEELEKNEVREKMPMNGNDGLTSGQSSAGLSSIDGRFNGSDTGPRKSNGLTTEQAFEALASQAREAPAGGRKLRHSTKEY